MMGEPRLKRGDENEEANEEEKAKKKKRKKKKRRQTRANTAKERHRPTLRCICSHVMPLVVVTSSVW